MKHAKLNKIIMLIVTIFLLIFLLKDNFNETIKSIIEANKLWLLLAIVIYIISVIFDALSYYFIVKQYNDKYTIKKAFRLNILTKFFNGITPLAAGGQPLQIYELHKEKIDLSKCTTIVIQFYIVFQIALIIISTSAIIINNLFNIFIDNKLLGHMVTFGYVANVIILFILIFISFNNKFNKTIIKFFIKIGHKLHIVKDIDKSNEKWMKSCNNYYESAQLLRKNKFNLIRGILLQLGQLIFLYSIPLIIIKSLNIPCNINIFNTIIASSYVFLIGCYIPIPGGTGGMEFGFMGFFKEFITKGPLRAATILWRFITFLAPVIVGGIIFNIHKEE